MGCEGGSCHEYPVTGGSRLCFGFRELCGPSMDQPPCDSLSQPSFVRGKGMSRSRKVPVTQRLQLSGLRLARTARNIVVLAAISRLFAQSPPVSSARPWHSFEEQETMKEAQRFHPPTVRIELEKIYSLAELIDLAETHNPETRVTWEKAVGQGASFGISRTGLF